ncbi:MAG TPA: hypothetical protein VHV83_15890 [Armatimonadota bacterium]|nr:hypothetical protein [Armatimonadota bacterium]
MRDIFARYFWNICLCESLYAPLQSLEVALRNSLHDNITSMIGTDMWFDTVDFLRRDELNDIASAKTRLRIGGKPLSSSNLVAALNFGFWTSLLDRHYHWYLNWPSLVNTAFPCVPKYHRRRDTVLKRLNDMRHLRNRVFHHEPIWIWANLEQRHQELCEAIQWINPQLYDITSLIDRFHDVYSKGSVTFRSKLKTYL